MDESLMFDCNPAPLLIYERDSLRILKANQAFCQKYDYTTEAIECNDLDFNDLCVSADHSKFQNNLLAHSPSILQHRSKTDDIFYVKACAREIEYKGSASVLVLLTDVSNQLKAQEKAEKAFQELSYHVKNTPLALIEWDNKFNITEWSERATEISGYTKEEVMGKGPLIFDFFSEQEMAKVQESMRALLSGEKERDYFEVKIRNKNGKPLSIKIHSSAFKDINGQLVSVLTLIEDFTEQQEAQEKLRRNEQLFTKLFTDAPQAMVMVDDENKVQQVNHSFEKLFEYQPEELLGKDLNKIIKAGEGYKKAPKIEEMKLDGSHIYSELTRFTKHGKELNLVVGGLPVFLDGELIAGFGIYIDITAQKEIQRKLQQSLDEKQVLLEEVHHRVKNNLAVVSGLLHMQTLHVDDERLTRYIQNSQLRIQSMAIVHEMLYKSNTLSHVRMNAYAKKLVSVIEDTLGPDDKTVKTLVESDDIELNVNQAIPCALAISELITNAYEYAFEERKKGEVRITLVQEGQDVTVKIRDDGIGLPDNFEEMRKKSLGLSLIENLCNQLETEIEINSGEWGTCFGFTFQKKNTRGSSSSNQIEQHLDWSVRQI